MFVHNEESIEAHFLSCFVSLLILRLLEKKTDYRIPVRTMMDKIDKANLAQLSNGTYMNTYCDNVVNAIGNATELDLSKKYYSAQELKTIRGKTKKQY